MLITGIRRENNVLNLKINDEPDENNETRLISCSSFLDHLMRSLRSIIDSMETRNFINLVYYWRNIHMQIVIFYNMLKDCTKVQLKPNKLVMSIDVPRSIPFEKSNRCLSPNSHLDSFHTDRWLQHFINSDAAAPTTHRIDSNYT